MTGRCRLAVAAVAAGFLLLGSPLAGQAAGTLGVGASVVEYDGFLTTGAAVLSPAWRFDAPDLSLGAQATWTIFESGNQILQGTAAAAWLTPPRGRWRIELGGAAGGSRYAGEPADGYVLARTRLHLAGERSGAWVGGATGMTFGGSTPASLELSAAAWRVRGALALVGTLTSTWLGMDRYVDLLGAVRWTGSRVELEARAGARPWTRSGEGVGEARAAAFAEVSALVSVSGRVALGLSGGSYPSDPVRRVLGATYVTAGLRWRFAGTHGPSAYAIAGPAARAAAGESGDVSPARLEIAPSGSPRTLRVHVAGVRSVEIRGDMTDWEPVALVPVTATLWEIRLPLAAGVYRMSVRINGGPWLVPAGTRRERTEFGDSVGVVVIP